MAGALMVCAGCGGGSSSNNSASAPTTVKPDTPGGASIMGTVPLPKPACDFLAPDEIAKVLGTPVGAATASGDASCTWGQADDQGLRRVHRVETDLQRVGIVRVGRLGRGFLLDAHRVDRPGVEDVA